MSNLVCAMINMYCAGLLFNTGERGFVVLNLMLALGNACLVVYHLSGG